MFNRRRVEQRPKVVPSNNGANRWVSQEQMEWRARYDHDRNLALAAGRSCGKCIDGVVYFGPHGEDRTPCTVAGEACKAAKQEPEQ